jgi:hypothetical protein
MHFVRFKVVGRRILYFVVRRSSNNTSVCEAQCQVLRYLICYSYIIIQILILILTLHYVYTTLYYIICYFIVSNTHNINRQTSMPWLDSKPQSEQMSAPNSHFRRHDHWDRFKFIRMVYKLFRMKYICINRKSHPCNCCTYIRVLLHGNLNVLICAIHI